MTLFFSVESDVCLYHLILFYFNFFISDFCTNNNIEQCPLQILPSADSCARYVWTSGFWSPVLGSNSVRLPSSLPSDVSTLRLPMGDWPDGRRCSCRLHQSLSNVITHTSTIVFPHLSSKLSMSFIYLVIFLDY